MSEPGEIDGIPILKEDLIDLIWSNIMTHNRLRRLSWAEVARKQAAELKELHEWRRICMDLDRCEHGRHEGDDCFGCDGPSRGNPIYNINRLIGFGIDGKGIVVPLRGEKGDPKNWHPTR